jgi:FkbM family methyltransferase
MPNLIERAIRRVTLRTRMRARLPKARRLGIRYVAPNFIYRDTIRRDDVILDAGCADDADFSRHMVSTHGARAFGIDPTRKHAAALASLETRLNGRFRHVPVAIAVRDGTLTFYESDENVSGSLLENHINVTHDHIRSYEVEAVSLSGLLRRLDLERAALIKLDLEGAEYDLLRQIDADTLHRFDQLFIEFHHHAVPGVSQEDTWQVVKRLESIGFQSFSLDDHNFLFWPRQRV